MATTGLCAASRFSGSCRSWKKSTSTTWNYPTSRRSQGWRDLKFLSLVEPVLVGGYLLADFSPLGLPIEKLHLSLRRPWLDFGVLATLPKLRELSLRTNLIALETLPALAAAEIVTFDCDFHWKTPVRSFRHLPDMPRVQRLKVDSIASLDGLERLSEARNLDLGGTFADLTPLAALPNVTFLRLESELFTDLAPLAQMPALRELLIVREVPFDLSPLANSASLREVRVDRCDIVATELAAINAALNPDQNDFLADTPRPLRPLRFINYRPQDEEVRRLNREFPQKPEDTPRQRAYAAEVRWGSQQIPGRLLRLLGRGWGRASTFTAGFCHITLLRYRDAIRIHEVLRELREFSAGSRYPWQYLLVIEPHRDLEETMEETRAREEEEAKPRPGHWLEKEFDVEQERQLHEEFREGRREEYERLAAEHRLRLQQEQDLPIDPAAFEPVSVPPRKPGGPAPTAVQEEDAGLDDDGDEGDLMEGSPGEPIADDAMEMLGCMVTLTEDVLWTTEPMCEDSEYLYGEPAEDWHSLPQPIEQRPRPA